MKQKKPFNYEAPKAPVIEKKEAPVVEEKKEVKSAKVRAYSVRPTCPLNVRRDASLSAEILRIVDKKDELVIETEKDGFGKLKDVDGWVKLEFVEKI